MWLHRAPLNWAELEAAALNAKPRCVCDAHGVISRALLPHPSCTCSHFLHILSKESYSSDGSSSSQLASFSTEQAE